MLAFKLAALFLCGEQTFCSELWALLGHPCYVQRNVAWTKASRAIKRTMRRASPSRLLGDSGYGSAEMLGWLVYEHGIEPHVTVFDKSERQDGTFSRDDFTYDHAGDIYVSDRLTE
jgi:hypothetical protein